MKPTVYSDKYPPKNRKKNNLDVLTIEVRGITSVLTLDPNRASALGSSRELPINDPGATSVLSGEPAFVYKTCCVELALSKDELIRMFRRDLHADEVLKLHSLYGVFHETHDDFYDEDTGQAWQPMGYDDEPQDDDPPNERS